MFSTCVYVLHPLYVVYLTINKMAPLFNPPVEESRSERTGNSSSSDEDSERGFSVSTAKDVMQLGIEGGPLESLDPTNSAVLAFLVSTFQAAK